MRVKKQPAPVPPPPFYDPERDGVTFSVLSGWLACREKARLSLSGLTMTEGTIYLAFGEVTHFLLQQLYQRMADGHATLPGPDQWRQLLATAEAAWEADNPRASAETTQQVQKSLAMAEAIMPQYFAYWGATDVKKKWTKLEHEFRLPMLCLLPSGRSVSTFLRGKIDGIFKKKNAPCLLETKTRGVFDLDKISDVLAMDLQVRVYLTALRRLYNVCPREVLYNLVRRPLLRQKVKESDEEFVARIAGDVASRPDWYFARVEMEVGDRDVDMYEREVAEIVTDFVTWWYQESHHYRNSASCLGKFGIPCDFLPVCAHGDRSQFHQRLTVFRELESEE